MKLIKIEGTFCEKIKDKKDFIDELEKISNNFPNNSLNILNFNCLYR